LGSGGGGRAITTYYGLYPCGAGGRGAGAMRLVVGGNISNAGLIRASGGNGSSAPAWCGSGGGGSGGSIVLDVTGSFTNTNAVRALGGSGGNSGGKGRIRITGTINTLGTVDPANE
jgi:hypothetical protein